MEENLTYTAFESRYKERDYIGSGGFAKVYKVFDHANNRYVALKISDVRPEWKKFTLKREVELVNSLPKHRNITRYDACYRFNTGMMGEMDFAILEFSEEGNLEQFLNRKKLSLHDKQIIIRGILDGISFLHRNGIIHRDLKAQNILIYREAGVWTPKITDFGLSRHVGENSSITNSAIGISYSYAAPEQIQNEKIDRNVDLWAVGVIIYRILIGELPFRGKKGGSGGSTQSQLELSKKIVNLDLPYDKLNKMEEPYQSVVKKCLVKEPENRAKSAELLIEMIKAKTTNLNTSSETVQKTTSTTSSKATKKNNSKTAKKTKSTTSPKAAEPSKITTYPEEAEKTVIINRIVAPPQEVVPPTLQSSEEPTQIVYPKNYTPPVLPDYTPPADYNIPNQNPTQIIQRNQANSTAPPSPSINIDSMIGEEQKSFNWFWLFIPLLTIALIIGGVFIKNTFFSSDQLNGSKGDLIVISSKKSTGETFNFVLINQKIESAKNNIDKLIGIEQELETATNQYPTDYQPVYLLAKSTLYRRKISIAYDFLHNAARTAIKNKEAAKMIHTLDNEKSSAPIKRLLERKNKEIIKILEK